MKRIDGGRGGGQLLRWAVAMAAIRTTSIEVVNIRGARDSPGLRPQHVAALKAAATFTDATVSGLSVGSVRITFEPHAINGGTGTVDVGTAGSIALVFDTVLPFGGRTAEPITLTATGGTDVKWSPPLSYHSDVKFPVLAMSGFRGEIDIERRGFYPKGGGRATLHVEPGALDPIELTDRGPLERLDVHSIATEDLEDASVASRQAEAAEEALKNVIQAPIRSVAEYVAADSTGTVVLVLPKYDASRAGFSALGEPGTPAETIGERAVSRFQEFHDTPAAVDRHLADQLLPFLVEYGGTITTPAVTEHVETAIDLLAAFGYDVEIRRTDGLTVIHADGNR